MHHLCKLAAPTGLAVLLMGPAGAEPIEIRASITELRLTLNGADFPYAELSNIRVGSDAIRWDDFSSLWWYTDEDPLGHEGDYTFGSSRLAWSMSADGRSFAGSIYQANPGRFGTSLSMEAYIALDPGDTFAVSGHFRAQWENPGPDVGIGLAYAGAALQDNSTGSNLLYHVLLELTDPGAIDEDFSVSWTNQTDSRVETYMWMGSGILMGIPVPGVPEPGGWAMLAAGLAIAGLVARRRHGAPFAQFERLLVRSRTGLSLG